MKKNKIIIPSILILVLISVFIILKKEPESNINSLNATIAKITSDEITLINENNIYTLNINDENLKPLDTLLIKYSGNISENYDLISYEKTGSKVNNIPENWQDQGIFSYYYEPAYDLLNTLTLDELIGSVILARHPKTNDVLDMQKYHLGGYVFFASDFENKTEEEVKKMLNNLQANAKIPLLMAVDEEGGKVTRISHNSNLVKEPFKSPSELYNTGGFAKIAEDTKSKSIILNNLGLNLNLAPVLDVSTDENDYIYERTLKLPTDEVVTYAKTVIDASKKNSVSYTLKHFPGYGNSKDTHSGLAINTESYETIKNVYLPPFIAGINAGAEAIMVSHNIMENIDKNNPASLSSQIHTILKNDLNFTGITITDDLAMGAVSNIPNVATLALLADNDLIITTDYQTSFADIKKSLENNTLSLDQLKYKVFKILAWKYYKGLL